MAETKINGTDYRVAPLMGVAAYTLLARLTAIGGTGARYLPLIAGSALKSADPDNTDEFLNQAAILEASSSMIKACGIEEIVSFKKDVIELAEIQLESGAYDQVNLDLHFLGNLKDAESLFNYVIKVQFADFIKGSGEKSHIALAVSLINAVFQTKK